MTKHARITPAEILRAKSAAEEAGLRLTGLEKRPDGTIKFEFGEFGQDNDGEKWFAGGPLYTGAA